MARDELARADQLAALKELAIERGFNPAKLEALEADVRIEQLVEHLKDWLVEPTLRGRLRRCGLLGDDEGRPGGSDEERPDGG
jgi:hypothetical protein